MSPELRPAGLSVAISPCPNDTFIFGAWILGLVEGPAPARFTFADVEELNRSAAQGRFDVVKVSAAAAGALREDYEVLAAGAAFGKGSGPKLVALPGAPEAPGSVAVPGLRTTALALLRHALAQPFRAVPVIYDKVAETVVQGRAEAGLLIHESALVPERMGLELRLDLGRWWDSLDAGAPLPLPLPLGVIMIRKNLDPALRKAVEATIQGSLKRAREDPGPIWPLVRAMARELDDATLRAHIEAYVDGLSMDMGERGRTALERLWDMAGRMPESKAGDAPGGQGQG